jgi:predicted dehydrogenase
MTANGHVATEDVRWGILGAGFIAQRFAAEAKLATGARVTAVASRDGERAVTFAQHHGIPRAHAGYEGLLSDPEVEIIYVATPHALHCQHALAALRHGKSILVEKPFTMNSVEAELLVAEAGARNLFLMEGMWTLCNPLMVELVSRVRSGEIGEVLMFWANVGALAVPIRRGSGLRFEDASLGASFMLECLVYPLAILGAVAPAFLDSTDVTAAATFSDNHIDETAAILLTTAGGAVASIAGGFAFDTKEGSASRAQIIGSRGCAEISDDIFNPSCVRIASADRVEVRESDVAKRGFAWQIEEASRSVRAGRAHSDLVSLESTVKVMALLDRARASANITVGGAL